ncbi:DUF2950 family protein [Caballeronia ptereochthonis]|uniref:Uncharacterized protein n=1 Tax=Caballeronia ptereochthonis TaxID=1777144 RepID=A0A158B871_9BURK|nr:DUF2950 family protein [Caballeronia ptereochthonis]SAK66274.1 hypothetical protein AWB83_02947 [Caballeronia ptereochthonis]
MRNFIGALSVAIAAALYWPADESKGEEPSPFGPLIAASANHFKDRNPGDAYHGYYFSILTEQGRHAPDVTTFIANNKASCIKRIAVRPHRS